MKHTPLYRIILAYGLLVLLLSSCKASTFDSSSTLQTNSATPMPTNTITPSPLSLTASVYPSSTLIPTEVHTPVPTLTIVPTLTADERKSYVQELLKTNADCQLPCWWGIVPGKTTWAETEVFLQYMGTKTAVYPRESGPTFHTTGGFNFDEQHIYHSISFFESSGTVVSIEVRGDGFNNPSEFKVIWNYFAPEQIIPTYGLPSRVWVQSIATVHEGEPGSTMPYSLWIFYDHLGVLLRYEGQVAYQSIYKICPIFGNEGNLGQGLDLFLQSPESNLPLEDLSDFNHIGESMILPLEEATDLTIDEFFVMLAQQNKTPCFETPRDIWP